MKRLLQLMLAILVLSVLLPTTVMAAMTTDVIDAADVNDDPFDFVLGIAFFQEREWAMITRERNALSTTERQMLNQNEFVYKHVKNILNINGKLGLYKDLEMHFTLPIHILETYDGYMSGHWRDKYWGGDFSSSQLAWPGRPSLLTDYVFGYPAWTSKHSGFGDMILGFSYAPLSNDRDKDYPSLRLTMDLTLPTGEEISPNMGSNADNLEKGATSDIKVGKRLLAFTFRIDISKRAGAADPYFGVFYTAPVSLGDLIDDPRHEGGFIFGTEAIAYEQMIEGQNEPRWKVAFDFQFAATIYGRGQDFNAITDALAWRRDKNNTASKTYWDTDPRANDDPAHVFYFYPGGIAPDYELPIEDRYVYLRGMVGFYATLYHYLQLRADVTIGHRTEHFLSLPENLEYSTLRPSDTSGYNTQINEIGARVKIEQSLVLAYTISLALTY